MDQGKFQAQMNRLAAAYRVDITAPTRAAYFLAFQKTRDFAFAEACALAIENEKIFPSIAALKEILRHRKEVRPPSGPPALPQAAGSVQCLTCWDAGYVRKDVAVSHPDFGITFPCPHCDGAGKPRAFDAEGTAFAIRDQATREKFLPYREAQAARRGTGNTDPLDATPPPDGFRAEVRERAAYVPVPTCMTPFVIVPKVLRGRSGFVGQWADKPERAVRADACDWCESREAVRAAMVNRYADVQEVKR